MRVGASTSSTRHSILLAMPSMTILATRRLARCQLGGRFFQPLLVHGEPITPVSEVGDSGPQRVR